jgi:hypothetical protein
MIGEIIIGERMNERTQAGRLDQRQYRLKRPLQKMNLELRQWVGPYRSFAQCSDDKQLASKHLSEPGLQ